MPTLQIAGAKTASAVAEAGGTLVLHSRHYHGALLRTLYEADGIDAGSILHDAGRIAADGSHGVFAIAQHAGRGLPESIRRSGLGKLTDATQLALRMQASMFFDGVRPKGGTEVLDKESGLNYYRFTITGTVRY